MPNARRPLAYWLLGAVAALGSALPLAALAAQGDDGGLPNTFISPPGQPFRAATGAPYPVVDWFHQVDKNADGRIDHAEFVADSEAFFKMLDLNADGILDPYEVSIYEHRVVPEILGPGGRAEIDPTLLHDGALLWRAQYGGGAGGGYGPGSGSGSVGPPQGDTGGEEMHRPTRPSAEEDMGTGASPYALLRVPEPVTHADAEFMFRGVVRKANFMALADRNFTELDTQSAGYLTLATLPKTPLQKLIEGTRRGRR
jgi:hypothetical protein